MSEMDNQQDLFQHPFYKELFLSDGGKKFYLDNFNLTTKKTYRVELIPYLDRYGYYEIDFVHKTLDKNNLSKYISKRIRRKVHRLVADTFIAKRLLNKDECIHHKDFNKTNNYSNNLEICSISENNTKSDRSQKHYTQLTIDEQILAINCLDFLDDKQMELLFDLSKNTLIAARSKRTWKRGWNIHLQRLSERSTLEA